MVERKKSRIVFKEQKIIRPSLGQYTEVEHLQELGLPHPEATHILPQSDGETLLYIASQRIKEIGWFNSGTPVVIFDRHKTGADWYANSTRQDVIGNELSLDEVVQLADEIMSSGPKSNFSHFSLHFLLPMLADNVVK